MGTPRLAEEDVLIIEDLLSGELEGEWVRVSAYDQGHRVSSNNKDAYCGAPLTYGEEWWERAQAFFTRWSHYENRAKGSGKWSPTPFYIAREQRKGAKCPTCKKGKDLMADEVEVTEAPAPVVGDTSPFGDPTPADLVMRQRFVTKVAWVARELGAVVLESGEQAA